MNIDQKLSDIATDFNRLTELAPQIEMAAKMMVSSLRKGGKIFFCGNGGSAADAQHLAAELVGRFMLERAPLSAWALTEMCDLCLRAPSSLTPRIQEMHIAVGHLLCEIVEFELAKTS